MTDQQIRLNRAGLGLIAIGAVFAATAVVPALHNVALLFLALAYWPLGAVPTTLAIPGPLLVAITGGLTAGLGGMLIALGRHVAPISEVAVAKVTRTAAWSWFITDSAASVLVGAPFNVVLNLSFLGLMLWAARAPQQTADVSA